ncbi:uncharacterized protein LOC126264920 [Aethina tumida]|uniref:uncharacterized protein LOC126264920 n=1 Tax=Aethina tumida TaxID=116153 RepID=UPI002147F5C2|nr:uncharacterized protein LOC126264920 [Aethina tumida]
MQRVTENKFLRGSEADVVCLQETFLKPDMGFFIPGYSILRADRFSGAGGGVGILIRNSIRHQRIDTSLFMGESIGVELALESGPIRIVSAYGCVKSNTNGGFLLRASLDYRFSVETIETPNHFPDSPPCRPDILSIFLCKNITEVPEVINHQVLSSDHNPVSLALNENCCQWEPRKRKTNWLQFRYLMETTDLRCRILNSERDIDGEVDRLSNDILTALERSTHACPNMCKQHSLPGEVVTLIRKKNRSRKLWQRTRDPFIKARYNALSREVRACLLELRSSSFQEFIAEAELHPRRTWKVIRSIRGRRMRFPHLVHDGIKVVLDKDKAEVFADSLERQCSPNASLPGFVVEHNSISRQVDSMTFPKPDSDILPTSPSEDRGILKALNNRKSPGPDTIPNVALKKLATIQVPPFFAKQGGGAGYSDSA